jgi:hypothetical protein
MRPAHRQANAVNGTFHRGTVGESLFIALTEPDGPADLISNRLPNHQLSLSSLAIANHQRQECRMSQFDTLLESKQ